MFLPGEVSEECLFWGESCLKIFLILRLVTHLKKQFRHLLRHIYAVTNLSFIRIVQANANVKQAIDAELSAVEAAVQPFVAPVVTLATTATAKVVVGLGVTGLAAAEAGLIAIASSLAATIA